MKVWRMKKMSKYKYPEYNGDILDYDTYQTKLIETEVTNIKDQINQEFDEINQKLNLKTNTYFVKVGTPHNTVQKWFDDPKNKIVEFDNGTHKYDTFRINGNTKIVLNPNTTIVNEGQRHTFINFDPNKNHYRGYNGEGNITITGGKIVNASIPIFHADGFTIENVNFDTTEKSHYIQLCGTRNVTIKNCTFNGQPKRDSGRQNVEMVQLDNCKYENFPYLVDKNSPAYDGTENENIFIQNNRFINTKGNQFYSAFGAHTAYANEYQKNIHFTGNYVEGSTFSVVQGSGYRNLNIKNNTIVSPKGYTFLISGDSANVYIMDNHIINGNMCYYGVQRGSNFVENLRIVGNLFDGRTIDHGVTGTQYDHSNYAYISLTAYKDVLIKDNTFKSMHGRLYHEYGGSCCNEALVLEDNNIKDYVWDANRVFDVKHCESCLFVGNYMDVKERKVGALSVARIKEHEGNAMFNNIAVSRDGKNVSWSESDLLFRDYLKWKTFSDITAKQSITTKYPINKYDTLIVFVGTAGKGTFNSVTFRPYTETFGDGYKAVAPIIDQQGELAKLRVSISGSTVTFEIEGGSVGLRMYDMYRENKKVAV